MTQPREGDGEPEQGATAVGAGLHGRAAARTLAEVTAAYTFNDVAEVLDQWTPHSDGDGDGDGDGDASV